MAAKVLVDTSAWIDFFRKEDIQLHEFVTKLLRERRAVGTGIVVLELLRGAKTKKELTVVSELFDAIPLAHESFTTHFEAGRLGYRLARHGHTVGTVDLLIAELAIENRLFLLSLDKHFDLIATHSLLKLASL